MANQAFEVKGLKELNAALTALPLKLEKKHLRKAMKEAGLIPQEDMEARARRAAGGPTYPVVFTDTTSKGGGERGPGHAADHIVVVSRISEKKGLVQVKIGPDKDHWYLSFQEFGTPNAPADPFMRQALDGNAQTIVAIVAALLTIGVKLEATKLAAKQKAKLKVK